MSLVSYAMVKRLPVTQVRKKYLFAEYYYEDRYLDATKYNNYIFIIFIRRDIKEEKCAYVKMLTTVELGLSNFFYCVKKITDH